MHTKFWISSYLDILRNSGFISYFEYRVEDQLKRIIFPLISQRLS